MGYDDNIYVQMYCLAYAWATRALRLNADRTS